LRKQNNQTVATAVMHPQAMDFETQTQANKTSSHHFISVISGCLMLLALAQPVQLGARLAAPAEPIDVILIIDTSVSMVLRDYQLDGERVSRMTMTQALLDRFTRRFSGKRIGLVVLGEKPHMLLQPSRDRELVRYFIHRLKPTIGGRLSALGDAVAVTADQLQSDSSTAETVMILISDAVTPVGNLSPIAGAERAAEMGAVLHTIAIGSKNRQASQSGELIYEPADLKLLKQMAELTGGESFHAVDVAAMDAALQKIEQRYKKKSTPQFAAQLQQPLYFWPLLAAILLLIVPVLLPDRRTNTSSA